MPPPRQDKKKKDVPASKCDDMKTFHAHGYVNSTVIGVQREEPKKAKARREMIKKIRIILSDSACTVSHRLLRISSANTSLPGESLFLANLLSHRFHAPERQLIMSSSYKMLSRGNLKIYHRREMRMGDSEMTKKMMLATDEPPEKLVSDL